MNDHVETTPDVCGGRPRLRGRRITVQHVAFLHEQEARATDEIAAEYGLTLGEVHAALAYYHDHRAEIDARADEDAAFADALRAERREAR